MLRRMAAFTTVAGLGAMVAACHSASEGASAAQAGGGEVYAGRVRSCGSPYVS